MFIEEEEKSQEQELKDEEERRISAADAAYDAMLDAKMEASYMKEIVITEKLRKDLL